MKKAVLGLIASGVFAVQAAFAVESIAVIDVQAAILSSEQAKVKIAELKKATSSDQNEIKELAQQIQALQEKMEQDAAVMSDTEKKNLSKDAQGKVEEFQFKRQKLQKAQQEAQQELMGEMSPKLEQAIQSILAEGEYSLILERRAAIWVSPELDITKKVTEKLNSN